MKFTLHNVHQYVDWPDSVDALCELMTHLGLEVESLTAPDSVCLGIVVGEVLTKESHPNADRLTLCQVQVGPNDIRQIVCGATNHYAGAKVAVALPGQDLPGGFKIEERAVRGVASGGMICSAKEIGVDRDSEGVLILPESAIPGESPFPYLTTIELSVTPNRPDCLGWIGLAREIAVATDATLRIPEPPAFEGAETLPITLEDAEGCPRYLGRIVRGVNVGPSPAWLRSALESVGLGSINNVADVTNFVLMEFGHPLHAFDLDQLAGPAIHVRSARVDEKIEAINHEVYALDPTHLVIADEQGPVAVAGVMGGKATEVSESTKNLLIECAYFAPSRIRKASRSLGLSSDSSFRFERGVDPENLPRVIDRCVQLIREVAGGEATSSILEARNDATMPVRKPIVLRTATAEERVGTSIAESHQIDILTRLGCEVAEAEGQELSILPPSFRPDLNSEIDLIEEIARHFGYRNVPSLPPITPDRVGEIHPRFEMESRLRGVLVSRGWNEAKSYSFTSPEFVDRLNLSELNPLRHSIPVVNPISHETSRLRTTLAPGLLEILERNAKRGERTARIFELGKVYLPDVESPLRCERAALGMVWMGSVPVHWSGGKREFDFHDAKGACLAIFEESNLGEVRLEPYACEYLHPGQSGAWMKGDQRVGMIGRIHPVVASRFDLPSEPILVEIDLHALFDSCESPGLVVHSPSLFPAIRRDFSLTVSRDRTAEELVRLVETSETPFLESFELFDRYLGEQIGAGNQSLAFRLTYRAADRTLTDEEVNAIHQSLLERLNRQLGAVQRGA